MEQVAFPIKELLPQMVLKVSVTGVRSFAWRIKIGGWILRLAALVMGMGLHVEVEQ
jgi:hypothetical protein